MPFVVTENCIKCKYTDCVEVCPVDCFHEGPNFLVIDPDECIDCTLCEPECPVNAIYPEDDVPAGQENFIALNAELAKDWPVISVRRIRPPMRRNGKANRTNCHCWNVDGSCRAELVAAPSRSSGASSALQEKPDLRSAAERGLQRAQQLQLRRAVGGDAARIDGRHLHVVAVLHQAHEEIAALVVHVVAAQQRRLGRDGQARDRGERIADLWRRPRRAGRLARRTRAPAARRPANASPSRRRKAAPSRCWCRLVRSGGTSSGRLSGLLR